jgi:hypothetical protein
LDESGNCFTEKAEGKKVRTLKEWVSYIHNSPERRKLWEGVRSESVAINRIHKWWTGAFCLYERGFPLVEKLINYDSVDISYDLSGFETGKDAPHGICRELIEGCIEALDLLGMIVDMNDDIDIEVYQGFEVLCNMCDFPAKQVNKVCDLISGLHLLTSNAYSEQKWDEKARMLVTVIGLCAGWIKNNGYDPERMLELAFECQKGA